MFSNKIIAPIVAAVTLIVGVILFDVFGILGFALIPIVMGVMMIMSKPALALLVFWITTLFTPVVELLVHPMITKITEQLMGLFLLVILLGDFVINKKMPPDTKRFTLILGFLLSVVGISAVMNKVPPLPLGFYMITYFKHIWIFYFGVRFLGPKNIRFVTYTLVFSVLIQLAFNAVYYLGYNPLPYYALRGFRDAAIGTLASCNFVAYMLIFFLCFLLSHLKRAHDPAIMLAILGIAALSLLQFYLTYTIHAYPVLLGAIILQFIVHSSCKHRGGRNSSPVILAFCAAVIILIVWTRHDPFIKRVTGMNKLHKNYELVVYGLKGDAYRKVFLHADDYLEYPFLGGGPGNYTSHIAFLNERPLSRLGHMAYRSFAQDQSAITMGGTVLTMPHTGLIAIWGELGPLGFIFYWGIYIYAMIRIWRQVARGLYTNKHQAVLAESIIPSIAAFIVLNLILDLIVVLPINLGLWIWMSSVWNPLQDDVKPESLTEETETPKTEPSTI